MTLNCRIEISGASTGDKSMDYMEDAKWEVENYLRQKNVDLSHISEKQLSEMVYRYYKNYYSYEMDNEFALEDAVNAVVEMAR